MLENRPSKKQRELLSFIDGFIKGNGYGPSYREIMRALDYKSVSTVAVHVDGLITRGYLRKKDNSARSLEVVSADSVRPTEPQPSHVDWLKNEIETRLISYRQDPNNQLKKQIELLAEAFELLGFTDDELTSKVQSLGG